MAEKNLGLGTVYCLRNLRDNRMYIGATQTDLRKRWQWHCRDARAGSPRRIHQALRKHGPSNFEVYTMKSNCSESDLKRFERWWISRFKTCDPQFGYNEEPGGEIITAEARSKMSCSQKRRWAAIPKQKRKKKPQTIEKIREAARNQPRVPCSEATKEKIRQTKLGQRRAK
jgi:group I intron endonuclease